MTTLDKIRKCRDRIRSNAHLLRRQPARRRHELSIEIDKANNDLGWHLDQLLREIDHAGTN